jgi:hypothetical protein
MRTDALEPAKLDKPDLEVHSMSSAVVGKTRQGLGMGMQPRPTPTCQAWHSCTGGGRRGRHGLLHAGHCQARAPAERHAHRPVAGPAEQGAAKGGPAGRDHRGGELRSAASCRPTQPSHVSTVQVCPSCARHIQRHNPEAFMWVAWCRAMRRTSPSPQTASTAMSQPAASVSSLRCMSWHLIVLSERADDASM